MKRLFLAAIVCFSLCLSACSSNTEDTQSDVLSADAAAAQVGNTVETTAVLSETDNFAAFTGLDVTEGDTGFSDNREFVSDYTAGRGGFGGRNFVAHLPETAELGVINVNNVDIDISGITLREFLDASGLKHCTYAQTDLQFADYEFVSGMYGIQSDENDPFSFDSLMSVEIIDNDGKVVDNSADVMSDNRDYIVKGVCASDFFMNGDFDVIFYNNIKCGMTIDDIYEALGGEEFAKEEDFYADDCLYLCNDRVILVILPKHGIADKIMLVKS